MNNIVRDCVNGVLNDFKALLYTDELFFEEVEEYCRLMYHIGENPLPILRNWLKRNKVLLPIHYIESDKTMHTDDILNKVCGRAIPLLIVEAVKVNGLAENVNIYFITGEILNRKYFNKKEN